MLKSGKPIRRQCRAGYGIDIKSVIEIDVKNLNSQSQERFIRHQSQFFFLKYLSKKTEMAMKISHNPG